MKLPAGICNSPLRFPLGNACDGFTLFPPNSNTGFFRGSFAPFAGFLDFARESVQWSGPAQDLPTNGDAKKRYGETPAMISRSFS